LALTCEEFIEKTTDFSNLQMSTRQLCSCAYIFLTSTCIVCVLGPVAQVLVIVMLVLVLVQ